MAPMPLLDVGLLVGVGMVCFVDMGLVQVNIVKSNPVKIESIQFHLLCTLGLLEAFWGARAPNLSQSPSKAIPS